MKITCIITALVVVLGTNAYAESWTCSAPNMVAGSYDGGATAYIHLSPYPNGKSYAVTKKGKIASGKTSNGTSFVCRQQ